MEKEGPLKKNPADKHESKLLAGEGEELELDLEADKTRPSRETDRPVRVRPGGPRR